MLFPFLEPHFGQNLRPAVLRESLRKLLENCLDVQTILRTFHKHVFRNNQNREIGANGLKGL